LRLWEAGHEPPWLAIEIVSPGHPYKDYLDTPARCAACGVGELWVYDPTLAGPRSSGGPFALQIWTRGGETMSRIHASSARGYSPALDAWLVPDIDPLTKRRPSATEARETSPDPNTTRLSIATAEVGGAPWPTLLEAERERTQAALAHAEEQRQHLERELEALRAERR
jgi:hypothetical protein